MSLFIDTAVIMYAAGGPHPMRDPCRAILTAVADGSIDAVTSVEVVQEIYHRFVAIDRRRMGVEMADATLDLFAPVVPLTDAMMRRMAALVEEFDGLSSRDLVHVATCRELGIDAIVTPDKGFDAVTGLARIDPTNAPTVLL